MRYKHELEKEADDYYQQKCEGAYIRSRAVWLKKGEKSTSYFLSLEQKQQMTTKLIELVMKTVICFVIMKTLLIIYTHSIKHCTVVEIYQETELMPI